MHLHSQVRLNDPWGQKCWTRVACVPICLAVCIEALSSKASFGVLARKFLYGSLGQACIAKGGGLMSSVMHDVYKINKEGERQDVAEDAGN